MVDLHQQRLDNRPPRGNVRRTSAKVAVWVAVGALYLGLILVYVWNHVQILTLQYEIEELKGDNQALLEAKDASRAQLKVLVRPERITLKARAMGLISANQSEVRVIQGDLPPAQTEALRAEVQPQLVVLHE